MDEFFGNNQQPNEQPNTAPQSPAEQTSATQAPNFNTQGFNTQGFGTQGNMTQNNFGSAPYPTSPNSYNTQNPFNSQSYSTQGFGTSPTMSQFGTQAQMPQKKNSKVGKIVFGVLIVACIIIASIFIGKSVSGNDNGSTNNNGIVQNDNKNNEGAIPNLEKSPYDTKEYSGKGAMTPAQIYEEVKATNVGILVYYQNQQAGEGSGVVVGEDKTGTYTYIITCAHVIADQGVNVQVQFSDSKEYDATIVGVDTKTDIGVLRIKATGFKAATFGDSTSLKVGTSVYAIGNPGGTEFFGSFTDGIVSALDRPIATSANSYYDLPCIQHTAAINPGNSGGALVNEFGQVVGINSSKIADTEYEDMGFAVPSEKVLEIYNQIVKHGYVTNRPMLGITYYSVASDYTYSAIAWKNNLPYGSIVIASISAESGLNNTTIRTGDIITAVNGKKLDDTAILLEAIENAKVGDKLTLTVTRLNNNGSIAQTFDAEVELVEDKGTNTVPQTNQNTEEYYPNNPFNPFGY